MVNTLIKYIDINKLSEYLTIYTAKKESKLVIHSKIFIFDNMNCLFTSANIYDSCFYSKGSQELGYIIENNIDICNKILLTINYELLYIITFKNILDYSNIFPPLLMLNKSYLLVLTLTNTPIHTPIDSKYNIYNLECDNVDYNSLKQKPVFLK
jgi:hypothetical protein